MKKYSILLLSYFLMSSGVLYSAFIDRNQPNYTSLENRELMTLPQFMNNSFSFANFKNSLLQNHFQKLISDQFPLRNRFLQIEFQYESIRSQVIAYTLGTADHPILFKNGEFYQINNSGYYVSIPLKIDEEKLKIFENRLWNFDQIYNKYGRKYQLYIYKPTLADETDWFDETFVYPSEGIQFFERMASQLDGKYTVVQQEFKDLDDYMEKHFKTDHHWNDRGAYQGYSDIIKMIHNDFKSVAEPYSIAASYCYDFDFIGSLSMKTMGIYGTDSFCDYRLNENNQVSVLVDGIDKKSGLEEAVLQENLSEIYIYEEYHGTNYQMIEYTNSSQEEAPSILILADSFSNSINDDLALHFYKTYVVDPRAYTTEEDPMNTYFSLDEFLATHDIDIILWLQYYESLYFDSRMYMHINLNYN